MKKNILKLVFSLAFLATVTALAAKDAARIPPYGSMNKGSEYREIVQGFEGVWPPPGWVAYSISEHTDTEKWFHSTESFSGLYCAAVEYDPDLIPQNSILAFEHMVVPNEDQLNFRISGSAYYSFHYDCTVEVNDQVLFSWADNVQDDWVYQLVNVDLEAYQGQSVEIAFRYQGVDGAGIFLDDVGLSAEAVVPPPSDPPENDTCHGAFYNYGYEIWPGSFEFETDNTQANSDYPLMGNSCTGYSASGRDVVYVVCMNQGELLNVHMQCGFDASLYIITDCDDPNGTCLIGADDTVGAGYEEIIGFEAPFTGYYYIIASAYSSGVGPIEVFGNYYGGGCWVDTKPQSFGGLKALYR